MSAVFTEPELLDSLARGVAVVLPNARAARALARAFDSHQRAAGTTLWDAAPALSWSEWTRSLWSGLISDGLETRVLLNSAQEHLLWREVVDASPALQTLTSPDVLAGMARSAWSLVASRHGLSRLRSSAGTYDARTFAGWAESFSRLCVTQSCLPAGLLDTALAEHARSGALRLDKPAIVAGSLELTPAQRSLLDALRASGADITHAALAPLHVSGEALRATTSTASPDDELLFAARWLRRFLESHRESQPPRIALVLPNPDEHRAELESVFREVLAPELEDVRSDPSSAPWEFTSGTPLLQQPLVADALDLLHWIQDRLPVERISVLLRSPFLGHTADLLNATRFDAHVLRRSPLLQPELTVTDLLKLSRRPPASAHPAPSWLQPLAQFLRNHPPEPSNTFAGWSEFFRSLLKAAGFPGQRQPAPLEFETVRAWDGVLDLLATLDLRGTRVSLGEATRTLTRLLKTATVHVAGTHAPIQIMRPADAEGSFFDSVVLLHATDEQWPQPQHRNPLLSFELQRSLDLPGTNPSRDAGRALAAAKSLLGRTTHALITNALHDADGPLRPSPLIRHLGLQHASPEDLAPAPAESSPISEELVPDDRDLPALPSTRIHGGAHVLRLQAACAFRAFAEMRLRSSSPETPALGLDARERGNIVHRALEKFWFAVRSQRELNSLTAEERDRHVNDAVDQAFTRTYDSNLWNDAYLDLQRDRLRRLLKLWLEEERKRGPFTVLEQEHGETIRVGPLELELRPDRIDEVDGGRVLVDYKTGHPKVSDWTDERPNDPQLPLYALLSEPGELKGMFFAHIRPGKEMDWSGLASDNSVLPALKSKSITNLDDNVDEWRRILTTLASNFAAGQAEVAPKEYPQTCKHCGQRLLCRLDPATLLDTQLLDSDEQEIHG